MSAKSVPILIVCVAALVAASCSETSSPTAPSPTAAPAPTPTPPAATTKGSVQVTVNPNPVPFSGQPITNVSSCANSKNTWFYDQVLRETGGSQVTFTQRVDTFDGNTVNNLSGLSIVVPANGSITLSSRWCSATAVEHTAQSSFTGTDASGNTVTATAGVVRLMKP